MFLNRKILLILMFLSKKKKISPESVVKSIEKILEESANEKESNPKVKYRRGKSLTKLTPNGGSPSIYHESYYEMRFFGEYVVVKNKEEEYMVATAESKYLSNSLKYRIYSRKFDSETLIFDSQINVDTHREYKSESCNSDINNEVRKFMRFFS